MYDRRLVEMRQLRHVASFVKLGRVDLVDITRVDSSLLFIHKSQRESPVSERCTAYGPIVALDEQSTCLRLLDDPSSYECIFQIL